MNAIVPYRRGFVFAACCLGVLLFGIVLTTLGAILPELILRFGLDRAQAGALFSVMTLGVLAGSLVFGPVVDRYGYRVPLIVSGTLVLLGLELMALASSLAVLRAGTLAIGLGGGVINGGTNALVADISEGTRSAGLSLLGVFFGIGAFGVPFALGMLLASFTYAQVLAGTGTLVALPVLFFLAIRFPEPKQPQGFPLRDALALLREPALLLLGAVLFFESGMEITVGGWAAAYVNQELAAYPADATLVLSLYWLGMTLARVALTGILKRVPPPTVLLASYGVAFAGMLAILLARAIAPAAAGLLLVGAGYAAAFPVVLGAVGDRYPHLSGTAFGIALVMALTGGMTLPYVTGVLADAYGLRRSFILLPAAIVCAVLLFLLARRKLATAPVASM